MGLETGISWTDHTFNPVWGCEKVSPACDNCYAEVFAHRMGLDIWDDKKEGKTGSPRRTFEQKHWNEPLKWQKKAVKEGKRHRVFCGSMCDWAEDHPTVIGQLPKLWDLIRATPMLDWQLLTKRPHRIAQSLPKDWGTGYDNVWLGTTVENNHYVKRAAQLISNPAKVHFISYEPALGPLDKLDLTDIEWVIYGGESGAKRRPEDLNWARDMKARCEAAGVAFWFKQTSGLYSGTTPTLDGEEIHRFPLELI
jgi:protein gp37